MNRIYNRNRRIRANPPTTITGMQSVIPTRLPASNYKHEYLQTLIVLEGFMQNGLQHRNQRFVYVRNHVLKLWDYAQTISYLRNFLTWKPPVVVKLVERSSRWVRSW